MTKNIKPILLAVFIAFIVLPFYWTRSYAQSPQETLNQYISDLQKNPNDYALREKIIKHVQTMRPAPAIPLEVERFEGRAEFAIKNAKTEADFLDAAKEYEKALLVAPWVPAYYFNQGIAFEKAWKLKEAKQSFEFYLLAAPDAQDARDVRKRIAGLEYAAEKAAKGADLAGKDKIEMERRQKAAQAEEEARAQQRKAEDFYRKCDGKRYVWHYEEIGNVSVDATADLRGKQIVLGIVYKSGDRGAYPSNVKIGVWKELWDLSISRMEMDGSRLVLYFDGSNNNWMYEKAYINEDGEIKFKFLKSIGESGYYLPGKR